MGLGKTIFQLAITQGAKCISHTRPPFSTAKLANFNPNELKLCPRFLKDGVGDVLELNQAAKLTETAQTVKRRINGKWVECIKKNGKWIENTRELSLGEFINTLGLKRAIDGYLLEITPSIEETIKREVGTSGLDGLNSTRIINTIKHKISTEDIEGMKTLINKASSEIDISTIDPYRLVLLYKNLKSVDKTVLKKLLEDMTPQQAAIVLNVAKSKMASGVQIDALTLYKQGGYDAINSYLRKGIKTPSTISDSIEEISKYISTQKLPSRTTVYRLEDCLPNGSKNQFGCLESLVLGKEYEEKSLSELMTQIDNTTDVSMKQKALEKLQSYVSTKKPQVVNKCFISTHLIEKLTPTKNSLVWELNLPKDLEATFIEGNARNNHCIEELELLIQKGRTLTLKNIEYDVNSNAWKIIADVK